MSGRLGRIGRMGRIGEMAYFADGTPAGVPVPMQNGELPADQGGNAVQGKGLDFVYQTPNILTLAAGASTTVTIQFDNNSVFTWLRSTVVADIAGAVQTTATQVLPLVTLQITDTGNGMSFMNAPIPLAALAGNAQLPFVLPVPQFIQPNASFQYVFTSYAVAGTTYANLRFQHHGLRVFQNG